MPRVPACQREPVTVRTRRRIVHVMRVFESHAAGHPPRRNTARPPVTPSSWCGAAADGVDRRFDILLAVGGRTPRRWPRWPGGWGVATWRWPGGRKDTWTRCDPAEAARPPDAGRLYGVWSARSAGTVRAVRDGWGRAADRDRAVLLRRQPLDRVLVASRRRCRVAGRRRSHSAGHRAGQTPVSDRHELTRTVNRRAVHRCGRWRRTGGGGPTGICVVVGVALGGRPGVAALCLGGVGWCGWTRLSTCCALRPAVDEHAVPRIWVATVRWRSAEVVAEPSRNGFIDVCRLLR